MKLLLYIWRNVTRNPLRTILTILSVGFSLALMTVLHGYMEMNAEWGREAEKHNRIVVMNKQGFAGELPIAYVDRVRATPGIVAATPYGWFGGNYKEERMPFAQFAIDPQAAFQVWSEFAIDPAQLEAWQKNRQGCVVDRRLAEKRGWKIGEKIPLQGTFYPVNLDLELCGTFDSPKNTDSLWFHWQYLDESLRAMSAPGSGNAGTIFAKTTGPGVIPKACEMIDSRFASSENPTRTQTEAAFAQMFVDMLGGVEFFIRVIGIVVAFALTLVAANAMAMSMRERTTEIAVLKAIGFSPRRVLAMILGEATVVTLLGGLLGIAFGSLCLQGLHKLSSQFFPLSIYELAGLWLVYLAIASACIGLLSGIVPAVLAARLSVVNGLRRVV